MNIKVGDIIRVFKREDSINWEKSFPDYDEFFAVVIDINYVSPHINPIDPRDITDGIAVATLFNNWFNGKIGYDEIENGYSARRKLGYEVLPEKEALIIKLKYGENYDS